MLVDLLYLFVIGSGWFLAVFLFLRRGLANRFFSILVIILMYEIFMQYLFREYDYHEYQIFFNIRDALFFLYGVLTYFYFLTVTDRMESLTIYHSLHMIPAMTVLAMNTLLVKILPAPFVSLLTFIDQSGIVEWRELFYFSVFISSFIYLALSLATMLSYRKKSKCIITSENKIHRNWQLILISYCYSILGFFIISTVLYFKKSPYSNITSHAFCAYIAIPVFFTGYISLLNNKLFHIFHKTKMKVDCFGDNKSSGKSEKYAKSRISESMSEEYLNRILNLLDIEKVYLDPDLTLNSFAEKACISPYHVSQIISQKLTLNFYSLINSRRITYAKSMLVHPEHTCKTVLEIAFNSGFNSKTTFNTKFKDLTGITPSEFRKTDLDVKQS